MYLAATIELHTYSIAIDIDISRDYLSVYLSIQLRHPLLCHISILHRLPNVASRLITNDDDDMETSHVDPTIPELETPAIRVRLYDLSSAQTSPTQMISKRPRLN